MQIVTLSTLRDRRGSLTEIFRQEWVNSAVPVQWNRVQSEANVLRGVRVLHLSSVPRKDWDIERRVEELRAWWDKIQTPWQRDVYVKQCLLVRRRALMNKCAGWLKSVASNPFRR